MGSGFLEGEMLMKKTMWLFSIIMLFIVSCRLLYPPIEELLIDVNVFPLRWRADPEGAEPSPSAPFGGIKSVERISLSFESTTAGAFEEIERYMNSKKAREVYNKQQNFVFKSVEWEEASYSYVIPEELPYKSEVADHSEFACTRLPYYSYPFMKCELYAQYGPYIVHFHIGWNLSSMSASELNKILLDIDERMAQYSK